ncbi:hypothetical protein [Flavobacterium sp. ACN6]|nr:hypothetical protein [Flavobacterium sp. ACN6]PBJ11344.1 hypothetical protein BSF42_27470 [Flavobacterium sp. ACN6]
MKTKTFTLRDFEVERISKNAQKSIMGGDPPVPPEETNNPVKGGGNGNG